jgi:hypothetical protein
MPTLRARSFVTTHTLKKHPTRLGDGKRKLITGRWGPQR